MKGSKDLNEVEVRKPLGKSSKYDDDIGDWHEGRISRPSLRNNLRVERLKKEKAQKQELNFAEKILLSIGCFASRENEHNNGDTSF